MWKGRKKANRSQYVKRWDFCKGSPDLSLTLSTSLASAQYLLHPPYFSPTENPSFPELPHILPSSLFPPEWSHWLLMPPSALNWLGTDLKIPPSQQLLWANREALPASLQLCPGGDSYPQSTKYGCWAHAWHSPNTHRKLHTQPPRSMDTFTQADYFSVSFFLSLHCF